MSKMIKWSKKLLLVIATAAIVLSSTLNVNAAAESIQLISAKQSGRYIAGVSFSYKRTSTVDYYYCLNIHKNTAQNVEAKLVKSGSVVDGGIVHILKNGYPYKSITGDSLFYVKDKDSEGFGNVIYVDKRNKNSLHCGYLRYNEKTGKLDEIITYNQNNEIINRLQIKYDSVGNVAKLSNYAVSQKFGTTVNELTSQTEFVFEY